MLLAEKYAQADMNAVRSYERNEGRNEGRIEGRNEGRIEGREEGIKGMIEFCQEIGISRTQTSANISEKYVLDEKYAEKLMQRYWKEP